MPITRRFLSDLEIDSEKIGKILEEYTDTLKNECDSYKKEAEKLSDVQTKLDEANRKLTESEDFKSQLETLKSEISAKETAEKKSGAFKKLLKENGYSEKGIEKIAKYGGYLDGMELDGNGGIKDADSLMTAVGNEWDEYKPSETTTYTEPSAPPKSNGTPDKKSEVSQLAEAYYNRLYGTKKED